MKENYNNLCVFNFGKHCYVIMKSNDKVMYFENVNGKYVMPITNFSLYDNQGKSLTLVNQHFFMNQLINRINIALRKGYFSNDDDIVSYLNDLKKNSESDSNLNGLFKGSLMGEINEDNFENNKRELLKYLDKFRFDTFVNYNNVSIFNGSLEKCESQESNVSVVADDNSQNLDIIEEDVQDNGEQMNNEIIDESFEVVDDVQNNIGSSDNIQDNGVDVIEDISEVNEVTNNVMENNMFDFSNVSSNDNNDSVDSSDYFSSLGNSNSQVQNTSEVVSSVNSNDYFAQFNETNVVPATNQVVDNIGISNNQNNLNVEQTSNVGNQVDNINNQIDSVSNVVQNDLNVSTDNSFVDNVGVYNNQDSLNAQQVNNIQDVNDFTQLSSVVDNQSNGVQSVDDNYNFGVSSTAPNLENPSFIPNPDFADPFSLSNSLDGNQSSVNTSYIDEVKDRLSTGYDGPSNLNQSQFNNEIGTENLGFSPSNVTLGDSVISDRNDLPELEKISSVPIDENSIDKTDKKGRLGIIIFMIFLVLALGALSFYLYNYVF